MKKWMKAIATMMVVSMAMTGCGGSGDSGDTAAEYTVGIVQQLEHPALDAATQGFQEKLTELMDGNVAFDYQNAQGEQTNCTTIATKFVSDGVDLIMANATTALQSAAAATADIPIVGTSVTDYVTAGVVDSNEAPGRNVTGASDLAPIDEQIAMLMELIPDVQKVGILYCSAEPNSIYQSQLAQAELDKAGVAWAEYTAADSKAVVTNAVSECDVLYVPTDNTMANNTEIIKNVAVPAGVPVIAGEEGICAGCGVATLSISYYDLGAKAAEMAYEILVNGADPAEMPIEYVSEGITEKYNAEIAETLNIAIPEGMVAIGE